MHLVKFLLFAIYRLIGNDVIVDAWIDYFFQNLSSLKLSVIETNSNRLYKLIKKNATNYFSSVCVNPQKQNYFYYFCTLSTFIVMPTPLNPYQSFTNDIKPSPIALLKSSCVTAPENERPKNS